VTRKERRDLENGDYLGIYQKSEPSLEGGEGPSPKEILDFREENEK
jgi:hypothetical protein